MILAESGRPAAVFSAGEKDVDETEHLSERMWLIFLKYNMHWYQSSFFIVLTLLIYIYFFFELEPELEDPEDCPRPLQSHEHHGKKPGLSKLDLNIWICLV